ncbi:MAG: hypothetical protein EBX37_13810 [Alphaproteobacteria bacterium]|nr:hypothetical protein [Alphaproteobacteria bacterium]
MEHEDKGMMAAIMVLPGMAPPSAGAALPPREMERQRLMAAKRTASSAARNRARALARVSSYSASGSLSATTPAPAWA